ncbi:metallopeptidase [Azotobacter vinelandii CA]|uniref:Metallopeptidase n=2 Tax=Azotobacter vinelandii TaxID=354 RepID=C1DHX6_AZOVD|nr:peptidoglycan DD-metalloendopeptidase family protein [Azotobacter vinelandii]ACO80709.1 metallopeptidase [Azotobacter vinelandii DJ]AGK14309.1 metallopeptidase [Azotobacter vinelandii CA]AGK22102.1 metallopeptidase [Azotobacter vinelandii CA6]WKN21461.1 peptidoglycan DD-metalloendopeptidase family protein [Azotobacter vinelandii]SFY32325.1 Murein DD-endopeptidase MepM and murein hydrolase activator NlpD, contain LysM domain [Azotobacter vinelandii]
MTPKDTKALLYPKSHILAAGGVAALLSLALLVFPSREVEAKKPFIHPKMENASTQIEETDDQKPELLPIDEEAEPPFVVLESSTDSQPPPAEQPAQQAEAEAPAAVAATPSLPATPTVVTSGKGDTLSTVFAKAGVPASILQEILHDKEAAKYLGRIKTGQKFEFTFSADGELQTLSANLDKLESVEISKSVQGFSVKHEIAKPEMRTVYARGVIGSSFSLAAKKAGLSHGQTVSLSKIFAYDIDFAQDIRRGDEFEVIYEEKRLGSKRLHQGKILAARFTNRGKTYTAVRYTNKQGATHYYTVDGNSMRKAFIRTPVDFARISSRFSNGRRHPILNKIRAHKGVDYAAPRGTPIRATGDGKVTLAGRKGGYGNTVIIEHGNNQQTLYAHMQGFAKGIRTGSSVKQGQIIGYIGTTGLSTGPHLHYEFQINGTHVDPLSQKLTMANPISRGEKQRFLQQTQPLMARMNKEKATMLAMDKR